MAINATQITFLCSTIRSLGIANEHDGENLKMYVFSCSAGNIYIFLLSGLKAYLSKWGGLDMFLLQAELAMYSPVMEDINTVGDQNRNIREFKEVVTFTNAFFLISLP